MVNQKNVSSLWKFYQTHSHNSHFRITGLEFNNRKILPDPLVKAMVFPVVLYECESWTVKNAERWRIDAFELWCWRRLLRVPWTAKTSNQSFLKISPLISLEGTMLKLKLQYFGHLMKRVDSLEKTLMLGGIGGRRDWWQEGKGTTEDEMAGWHHLLDGLESEWTPEVGDGQGVLACCYSCGHKESDTTERLNWTGWGYVGNLWRSTSEITFGRFWKVEEV